MTSNQWASSLYGSGRPYRLALVIQPRKNDIPKREPDDCGDSRDNKCGAFQLDPWSYDTRRDLATHRLYRCDRRSSAGVGERILKAGWPK
jgi:hypothetical protein